MEILILGAATAVGLFVIVKRFLGKLTIKKHSKWLDLTGMLLMALVFFGTMTGMAIAAVASLIFSGLLSLNNKVN